MVVSLSSCLPVPSLSYLYLNQSILLDPFPLFHRYHTNCKGEVKELSSETEFTRRISSAARPTGKGVKERDREGEEFTVQESIGELIFLLYRIVSKREKEGSGD